MQKFSRVSKTQTNTAWPSHRFGRWNHTGFFIRLFRALLGRRRRHLVLSANVSDHQEIPFRAAAVCLRHWSIQIFQLDRDVSGIRQGCDHHCFVRMGFILFYCCRLTRIIVVVIDKPALGLGHFQFPLYSRP